MYKTITPPEMRRVEERVINETGVSGETLMQRAAAQIARAAARLSAERSGMVLCLCGTGNNGGDGLAAMRMLAAGDSSFMGECWLLEGTCFCDAQRELTRLEELVDEEGKPRVAVVRLAGEKPPTMPPRLRCVIDALFGTGLSRPLAGMAAALCACVNAAGAPVLAVDIPSGLNGETGEPMGAAICASETVTFHRPKAGLYLAQGPEYAGRIRVADIGLPPELDDADGFLVLEKSDLSALLPKRRRISHKGSYGRALLWVGSRGMAGAAAICATAALRAGAGLVTVACPEEIVDTVQILCPCATCLALPADDPQAAWERLAAAVDGADAVGVGCGLGQSEAVAVVLERLLAHGKEHSKPTVLDADALNLLAAQSRLQEVQQAAVMPAGDSELVMTPHPAEAARLLCCDVAQVAKAPVAAARRLRERFGASIVLKGAVSVLAGEDGIALNPFGTPAMAKGGSGDALTGIMTALLAGRKAGAYSMGRGALLRAACALHGLAGELAERQYGERGVLATDLCALLGLAGDEGTREEALMAEGREREPQSACATENAQALEKASPLGKTVAVTVDRMLGARHPEHRDLVYQLNYGYVQETLALDNDWQDAYIYGVSEPLEWFEGEVIAVIHRLNDVEDKWVVAKRGTRATTEEIARALHFQEQFYESKIECIGESRPF